MKKASIFLLGNFIFKILVLKLIYVPIFNLIWLLHHESVRESCSKRGEFWEASPAPQIKIFEKGNKHPYRIIPFFRKTKMFGYWIIRRDILPHFFADTHTHTEILAQLKLRMNILWRKRTDCFYFLLNFW